MKTPSVLAIGAVSLLFGIGIGFAAKITGAGIAVIRDKPAKEAALAALASPIAAEIIPYFVANVPPNPQQSSL